MINNCQIFNQNSLDLFFERNPVFTLEELDTFLAMHRTGNSNTRNSLLAYYKRQGRIISIRRGLFATVPRLYIGSKYQVDPFLVASKLATDAILSHHTALEIQGKAYSMTSRVTYTSTMKGEPFTFQGMTYQRANIPPNLKEQERPKVGTIIMNRMGIDVIVTGFERTMVDVLSRSDLSGSWEEIWRSLESIEFFDLDLVAEYLSLLDNSTTFAKVGFYLEQHKALLMVDEAFLQELEKQKPKSPHYIERGYRKDCILQKRWNLMVPKALILQSWGEVL